MLVFKLFDEAEPVAPVPGEVTPDEGKKESEGQKPESPEDKPEVKPEDKPKDDGKDYKAMHEASEAKLKEFESGVTPKLMKLAEFEKAEEDRKPKEDDDLARIDKRIADVDKQIPLYQQDRLDTTSLEASKDALLIQRKRIIEDKHAQAASAQIRDFRREHKDLKNNDFDAITNIIEDAEAKGQPMGLYAAYEIYDRDRRLAKASDSSAIDKESKDLGGRATGQDGKPVPSDDKGDEGFRKADVDFYTDQLGSKEKALKMLKSFKK